jgi:hypothetical protein
VSIVARLGDKQFNGHRLRRIPHPLDEVISGVVHVYRNATPPERRAMLVDLPARSAGVLCTYAERLAAVAVRAGSIVPLHDGLVAVGMAVEALDDDRDHLYPLAAVNHSAAMLGVTFAALVNSVADDLPTAALARLRAFDEREERDRSLQAFGLRTHGSGDDFRYC